MNIWRSLKPDHDIKDWNDVMREERKTSLRGLIVFGLIACWCVAGVVLFG